MFTQNRFCAAPVQVCREHLSAADFTGEGIRAILVNTGNANAGTGVDGLARALPELRGPGRAMGVRRDQILPFSTGVIMETLPVDRIIAGLACGAGCAARRRLGRGGRWAS